MSNKRQRMNSNYNSPSRSNNTTTVPETTTIPETTTPMTIPLQTNNSASFSITAPIPIHVTVRMLNDNDLTNITFLPGSSLNHSISLNKESVTSQESTPPEFNLHPLRLDSYEAVSVTPETITVMSASTMRLQNQMEREDLNRTIPCPPRHSPGDLMSSERITARSFAQPIKEERNYVENPPNIRPQGPFLGQSFMSTTPSNVTRTFQPISDRHRLNLLVQQASSLLREFQGTINFIAPLNNIGFIHELPSEILHIIIAFITFMLSIYRAHLLDQP
jgi:hypothetical protein